MREDDFENVTCLETSPCPVCGANLNAATPAEGCNVPGPGDFSMCFYCGEYLRFDDDMQLQSLTDKDIAEAPLLELSYMRRVLNKIPPKH
jgi:hypothetical protein